MTLKGKCRRNFDTLKYILKDMKQNKIALKFIGK